MSRLPFAVPLPHGRYAVFDYGNANVRFAIRDLKYHRKSEGVDALVAAAASHIADMIGDVLQSITATETLVLVPIPEHPRTLARRGFNQSAYITRALAALITGATVAPLLEKTIPTAPQAHLHRGARLKNVAHTMRCNEVLDPKAIYLIIDDVTTTGATFEEATRALKEAGARKVHCIALAHGYAKK
ncbi:MAG TPA: phosphoribosyltransferase family protein [Candidatus Paceibacterota bacterium]|nr:phosphoribosyltransferase family protein [Candidatus Paceibacterota bacterium]